MLLKQSSQKANNFVTYLDIFQLISSFTSPLADDDYKIVIKSLQHITIVIFHSCSL